MLLSGLTTWLSVMTASRRVSIVGSSASSPGASRLRVSATVGQLLERTVARGQLVDHPALGQQPIGHPVLGQQPLDESVLVEQLIDQAARFDGAHQPAVLLGQPVEHSARRGQPVHHAAGLQQPIHRTARRQRTAQRLVLVHQPGQLVDALNGVVDPQDVRYRSGLRRRFPRPRCDAPCRGRRWQPPGRRRRRRARCAPGRWRAAPGFCRGSSSSLWAALQWHKLTGSPQLTCRATPSEVVDIEGDGHGCNAREHSRSAGPRRRRRDQHRRAALGEPEIPGLRGPHRLQRSRRAGQGPRSAARRGDPRRDDARHGRLRPAAPAARRRHRRAGAVPHRPRHVAGQDRRPDPRRRRLRHQAVQPGRGGGPAARHPATRGRGVEEPRTSG